MKNSVKRLLAGALLVGVLSGVGYALAPEESLITLKYVTEQFVPSARKKGTEAGNQKLQETFDIAKSQLDAVQRELMKKGSDGKDKLVGEDLAPGEWTDGEMIELGTGAGLFMGQGAAVMTHNGAVIDVGQGTEVASGTKLHANHRYLVGEDTRAVVKIMSGAAKVGVQGTYQSFGGKQNPIPFYDVSRLDWYYQQVAYVYEKGLFAGTSDHTFGPEVTMNRAMVMTVFYKLAGKPEAELNDAANIHFSDVSDTAWYAPYVKWAAAQNITSGTGGNKFSPDDIISREQFVQLLYNFSKNYLKKPLSGQADLNEFKDAVLVGKWAQEAVSWAVHTGIVGSTSKNEKVLMPQGPVDRAAAATMLMNYSNKIK